jgi:hypothetical protein
MDLARSEPLNGLDRIQTRINQFFDEAFGRSRAYPAATAWYPPVDILESRDAYLFAPSFLE